jgi:hypothetical protein
VRWARTVRAGLRARGVSIEKAAKRIDVPVSTFRTWLRGSHLPSVTIFNSWRTLAQLAGLTEVELLRAAGVLPDTFASSIFLSHATREVRDSLDRVGQLLRETSGGDHASGVTRVISELSLSGINWEIRLRSALRGSDITMIYHHYVGIVPPPELASWTGEELRSHIQREVLADIWRPLGLYWRQAELHDWQDAPDLLIQVPEQESSRPPNGLSPRPDGQPITVLSPPWGYGELLGSLVADGIGFGNIDFRYFGVPDNRPDRATFVQAEINNISPGFVVAIPPLLLLEGIRSDSAQLAGTLPILILYGDQVRARAAQVYQKSLAHAGGSNVGIATVQERNLHAVLGLPPGTRYLEVTLADDDVIVEHQVDRHRMNDTIAWLALTITRMILKSWNAPPVPVGGPLRSLILPSGRVRQTPRMASQVLWRACE